MEKRVFLWRLICWFFIKEELLIWMQLFNEGRIINWDLTNQRHSLECTFVNKRGNVCK